MEIVRSLRYDEAPLAGRISISEILANKPIKYKMMLFRGSVQVLSETFKTTEKAVGRASLLGFNTHKWLTDMVQM